MQVCDTTTYYLIALLDDSNDFSWQAAKASHAVLLCRMEQGEVISWSETDKIDRIRRANAQRHVIPTQANPASQKKELCILGVSLTHRISSCIYVIDQCFRNIPF